MAAVPSTTPPPTRTSYQTYPTEINEGKTTTFKALTQTDYSPDAGCETAFWKFAQPSLVGWDPGYNLFNPKQTGCHPTAVTDWWDSEHLRIDKARTAISLGPIVCPSPYTTAKTSLGASSRTLVGCCPTGYTFVNFEPAGSTGECESKIEVGQVFTYITSSQSDSEWKTVTSTVSTASKAYAIQINGWNFPNTASTTSSSASGQPTDAKDSINEGTPTPTPAASTGLSSAATVGLAVGISLAVAIIAGGVFAYYFIKRRRARKAAAAWIHQGHSEMHAGGGKMAPGSGTSSEYTGLSPDGTVHGLGIGQYYDARSPVNQGYPAELNGAATPPMELHGSSNMMAVPRAELATEGTGHGLGPAGARGSVEPKTNLMPGYS